MQFNIFDKDNKQIDIAYEQQIKYLVKNDIDIRAYQ